MSEIGCDGQALRDRAGTNIHWSADEKRDYEVETQDGPEDQTVLRLVHKSICIGFDLACQLKEGTGLTRCRPISSVSRVASPAISHKSFPPPNIR